MAKTRTRLAALAAAFLIGAAPEAYALSRIKDLADVEGVRSNMLIGYGLVVGLNNTGDSVRNAPFTSQALQTMLERLGVNTRGATINTKDVAAVMVTAKLPPFASQGGHIDVTISAMGDAKSLLGGTLLATPLLGADGEAYALAQGQIAVGGFSAQGAAASVSRGAPTSVAWISAALGVPTLKILRDTAWTAFGKAHEPFAPSARLVAPEKPGDWRSCLEKALAFSSGLLP